MRPIVVISCVLSVSDVPDLPDPPSLAYRRERATVDKPGRPRPTDPCDLPDPPDLPDPLDLLEPPGGARDRQGHAKSCAGVRSAAHVDAPVVRVDDLSNDRQPETGARH